MKKVINNIGKEDGFTLHEVLIAIAIFSIGILASVAMQYRVVSGNANGNVVSQEMMMAQWVMEQKKNQPDVTAISTNIPSELDTGPYDVSVSVSNPAGGASSRLITVTVTKQGGWGGHPVVLRSMTMGNGI